MRYKIQFVTHNILMGCLEFGLLEAYATQKVSDLKKELYECVEISDVKVSTHRNLCNKIIISYVADLILNNNLYIRSDTYFHVERECRRIIPSSHSDLVNYFNVSCNDFSDSRYNTRVIEILFDDYRMIIDPKECLYSIQYKKCQSSHLIFLNETNTLEINYVSLEGDIHLNPIAIRKENALIGVASFLDSKDLSVKTTYLNYRGIITLYQRVAVDDYSKSHPFILELEEGVDSYEYATKLYLETACRLQAKLPSEEFLVSPVNHKPISRSSEEFTNTVVVLPKLDGIPASLKFYDTHFVVTNTIKSQSFPHKLSALHYYVLKDYKFLVESELYTCSNPPNAMAIIDIQTGTTFTPIQRYEIMQRLRIAYQTTLEKYNIFFNSSELLSKLSKKREHTHEEFLKDEKIYEVLLNSKKQVIRVIRERNDKLKPNSGKLIRSTEFI